MEFYSATKYSEAKKAIEEAHRVDPRPVYLGFRAWCIFRIGDQVEGLRIMNQLSQSTDLSAEERLDFEAAVSRMQDHAGSAQLNLRTEGTGIETLLDGTPRLLKSAEETISIVPGSHSVVFRYAGEEKVHEIFVDIDQLLELSFQAPATIKFDPGFSGSILYIDDTLYDFPTSLTLQVKAGAHQLKLMRQDREVLKKKLVLKPGEEHFVASPPPTAIARSEIRGAQTKTWILPTALVATGASLIAGGVYFHDQASVNANSVNDLKPAADSHVYSMSQDEAVSRYNDSRLQNRTATALFVLGGATISGALLWSWLSPDAPPAAAVGLSHDSLWLQGSF